jgi:alkylhydroperoxidase/carboxymuconolactone decarboxylase family protein YurZ
MGLQSQYSWWMGHQLVLVEEEEDMKKKQLPESVVKFQSKYPEIWKAFAALGEKCHEIGPLDEKTRRLVKLGIAIAARHEGAVHSATRNALDAGLTPEELFHTAILSITTIGWPMAYAVLPSSIVAKLPEPLPEEG